MLSLLDMTDYYINANRLRTICQRLKRVYRPLFEISLNASLVSSKLSMIEGRSFQKEDEVLFDIISNKVNQLAREQDHCLEKINKLALDITELSLKNKLKMTEKTSLQIALEITHGENNREAVLRSIGIYDKSIQVDLNKVLKKVDETMELQQESLHTTKKLWLTLSNLRIDMSQRETSESFQGITTELEKLIETAETLLNELHLILNEMKEIA
jgi:hypothetical protein